MLAEAEALLSDWPKMPTEQKRGVVEAIVERITIGKGEIHFTLSAGATSKEVVKSQQALRAPSKGLCPCDSIFLCGHFIIRH